MKLDLNKCVFAIIFLFHFFCNSQEITGNWKGELEVPGAKIPLIFHIVQKENTFITTFDSPTQMAENLATQSTSFKNNVLVIDASNLGIVYTAKMENKLLVGEFKQSGMTFPLNLSRILADEKPITINRPQTPQPPFDYPIEEVSFVNPKENNQITGTLCLPKNLKNPPIILLINGSGQQDRNSEILKHKIFLVIADFLAKNGFGSLRLDDRGVGGSNGFNAKMTSANSVSDMRAAVDFLKKKNYQNIGVLGHSEGGLIAPLLAENNKDIKFMILLAAPGIDIAELMYLQNEKISELAMLDKSVSQVKNMILKKAFEFVQNYKGKQLKVDLEQTLKNEYLQLKMDDIKSAKLSSEVAESLSSDWFEFFLKYNAKKHLANINQPTLALNGSLDCQVTSKENLKGIRLALPKNPKNKIIELSGLNHLFQEAKTGNISEYIQIEQSFSPKALSEILIWLKTL